MRVVFVTVGNAKLAGALARGLVEKKLAACVNILSGVTSHYRWKGKIHADKEFLLIIKTRTARLAALIKYIKANHDAEIPEIISLPVTSGYKPYLDWIKQSTR